MSFDMFPDAAIDYLINNPGGPMTDQKAEERIALEEIPLTLVTTYYEEGDHEDDIVLTPGAEPFITFQMRQVDGSVQCDIAASLIQDDLELIETLEVFLEALIEARPVVHLDEAAIDEAVADLGELDD